MNRFEPQRFWVRGARPVDAFWTTRTQAVNTTYIIFAVFLSGRFTPLELLPGAIQTVARALPFRLWASFPVELLMGRMTPAEAWTNVAQQLIWIVAFYGLLRFVWSRGLRRYSAVGA